jgi:hypothetical protein
MLIRVRYRDQKYDMVKPWILDHLLTTRKLRSFERSSGWVLIGEDSIRGDGGNYRGTERRQRLSP